MLPRRTPLADVSLLAGVLVVGLLLAAATLGPVPAHGVRPAEGDAAPEMAREAAGEVASDGTWCPVPSRAKEKPVIVPQASEARAPVPPIDAAAPALVRRATFALG